jgi:integrase
VTVRELAGEWLHWLEHVKGASPSTVAGYRHMLAEAGQAKRGTAKPLAARVMTKFGDRPAASITTQELDVFLAELDETLSARTVNLYRQTLCNLYVFGSRAGTYGMTVNPAKDTDRRRVPPPAPLDYFEVEEVEALARAAASGQHRKPRGRARPDHSGPDRPALLTKQQKADQAREQAGREAQDRQDAEMFRVLLYSGMRIGEALALRWGNVAYLPDMSGGVLDVRHAVSAGTEKPPKSWKPRTVPLVRPAAEALARLQSRDHFVSDDDYVFVNDIGGRLEYSALRRRYHAARQAAGLRDVKLHGLRHAAGSIMAAGMPLATVRDMLGHAQMTTTNRYLHGKADARAVAALNLAFGVQPTEAPTEVDAPSSGR